MKKIKFYLWALLMVFATVSFVACSDEDDPEPGPDPETPVNPGPGTPVDPDEPDPNKTYHYDLWVSLGSSSGMTSRDANLVKGVTTLEEGDVDFVNDGVDVTDLLHRETIVKGQYYYQIRKDGTRFGKYRILDEEVEVVAEFPFTTLKDRRHTHVWLDETSLLLIGSNGESSKILWVKVNAETMTITGEGELDLPEPDFALGETFNTSGIAAYRKNDNTILYSFVYNPTYPNSKVSQENLRKKFYVAFINPSDMSTIDIIEENRAQFMAGTAFGELLQEKSFFTSNGDYYLACSKTLPGATSSTQQSGVLLRIKNGEKVFDPGFTIETDGKIVVASRLDDSRALIYFQDPAYTGAAGWSTDYNSYYAILPLENGATSTAIPGIPFCSGTFSQRSVVVDGKAYIGTYPKDEQPAVYIYDIATGNIEKGLSIRQGYEFDRIVVVED